jgi:Zn-dependent protease
MENIYSLLIQLPLLLFSITIHELSHGFAAYKLGDDTAKAMGRLTLNPVAHIDFIGTIVLPVLAILTGAPVFGWAKPVPVDPFRMRDPRTGMMLVGIAGPAANLAAAALGSALLNGVVFAERGAFVVPVIYYFILLNLVLCIFNLIPVPPLDGSQILAGILPPRLAYEYQKIMPYGIFIIMFLLISGAASAVLWPVVKLLLAVLRVPPVIGV